MERSFRQAQEVKLPHLLHPLRVGFHQKTSGSSSQEEAPEEFAFASDDEWVIDEANMELIRVHKQMRKALYQPKDGLMPIPLEFLDTKRKTIMEFPNGKSLVKEDDWSSGELPTTDQDY